MEAHRNSAGICQVQRICIKTGLGTQLNPDSYGAASKEWSPTGENLILSGERTNPISSSIKIPQNPSDVRFWWCFDYYNYNLWLHITIDKPLLQDYIGEKNPSNHLQPPSKMVKHPVSVDTSHSIRHILVENPIKVPPRRSLPGTIHHVYRGSPGSYLCQQPGRRPAACASVYHGGMGVYPVIPSGYVKIAIEHGHWNSEFSH